MRARLSTLTLAITLGAFFCTSIANAGDLLVANGWIRPAQTGEDAKAFFVIRNKGKKARTIIGASSPRATRIEVHRTAIKDGQWSSEEMPAGMTIPPRGDVAFVPRGLFLRIVSEETFVVGETVPMELELADGETLPFDATVKDD